MDKSIKIMLLGSIPKGNKERESFFDWKKEYTEKMTKEFPNVKFLHGDLISDKVGSELVVGHDLWLVKHADIIIANAMTKVGAGTAQEMVIAKMFKKPLVAVIPKDTHHRRSNVVFDETLIKDWIHPFLFISSDYVSENIEGAISWIKKYLSNPKSVEIKDISVFDKAIGNFEKELSDIVREYKNRGW